MATSNEMPKIKKEDSEELSWGDYFMGFAIMAATRSKDPNYQVGACIVNEERRLVSTGYNGFVDGVRGAKLVKSGNEKEFPWEKGEKNDYVCHAELNAIANAKTDISGCTLYVTRFPCHGCVYYITYEDRKPTDKETNEKVRKLFMFAGDQVAQFKGLVIGSYEFADMHEPKDNFVKNMYEALRINHEQAD